MKNRCFSLLFAAFCSGLLLAPAQVSAEPYVVSLNLLAGIGGSLDGEPSSGFGNQSFQIGLLVPTDLNTVVGLRVGRLSLDSHSTFEGLADARLDYANVAGEYRFGETFYTSGIFLGLGAYRLSGDTARGHQDTTQIGAVVGADGEFILTRRLAIDVEVAGHYVNFEDAARMYVTVHAGLAIHF